MLPLPTKVQNATLPPKKTQIFNWQKSPVSVNRTPRPTYSMFTSIPFRHIKNHIGHDEQKIFARGKCSNHKSLSR